MEKIKWGVIGSGRVARRFVSELMLLPRATIVGVASRNPENSARFGAEMRVKAFPSVTDLLASDADVIHVATPHSEHHANAIAAIEAGKAVLCEKPFAMNLRETQAIIGLARDRNVFVMEAMWTRFFPVIQEVIEIVQSGGIGEIQRIETSFGYQTEFDPISRVFDPRLGGGSVLDVGVYFISLTRMLIDEYPAQIVGSSALASAGVDVSAQWELKFASGTTATGASSVVKTLPNEARIVGTTGEIVIPRFWCPNQFRLNGSVQKSEFLGEGFGFEANEVMDCFRKGIESPRMSHQHTLDVMRIIDEVRRQCGIHYPPMSDIKFPV